MAAQYLNPQRAFILLRASLQSLRNREDKRVLFHLPFNFLFYYLNIHIFIDISEYPDVFSAQVSVPSQHMRSFLAALTTVSPVQNPPFISEKCCGSVKMLSLYFFCYCWPTWIPPHFLLGCLCELFLLTPLWRIFLPWTKGETLGSSKRL